MKELIKRRCLRILPVLILYKILCVIFLGESGAYILSNIFMLNKNIGIDIPTLTHIIWYVDVMFWVYLFYLVLFYLIKQEKALFLTTILMLCSLMILFSNENINFHFSYAAPYLDGGLLRGIGFIGMGILLANLPALKEPTNKKSKFLISIFEVISLINVFFYPLFFGTITKGVALNHVLWAALFIFLFSNERGWVSQKLNKRSKIKYVSKYAYEIYVFQLFAITLSHKWLSPNQHPFLTAVGTVLLAYVFGVLVHEIYQKRIVGKIFNKA